VSLLAFDEFQITNIADALIVETLFDALFCEGVMVMFTSNRPPEDLYKDGLNRHLAIPQFLSLLESRNINVHEISTLKDFRLRGADTSSVAVGSVGASTPLGGPWRDFFYCQGDSSDTHRSSTAFLTKLIGSSACSATPKQVPIAWGRKLIVQVPSTSPGVGHFNFSQLCSSALSADDYLQLAEQFHTFVVDGVPRFSLNQHNEARRFTNLVDCLYERHARLIISAAAPPGHILEDMETLAVLDLKESESSDRPRKAPGGGSLATGMLGLGASAMVRRSNPTQEPMHSATSEQEKGDLSRAARSAAKSDVSGRAGEDDSTTGANVAGVMTGAVASLQESGFAARRATSRLLHMQSEEYLQVHKRERLLSMNAQ
jgi:predicted ATPase